MHLMDFFVLNFNFKIGTFFEEPLLLRSLFPVHLASSDLSFRHAICKIFNTFKDFMPVIQRPDWNVPEDDIGALGLIVDEIKLVRHLLHLFDLVVCQLHQPVDLFLKTRHSLKQKPKSIEFQIKRPLIPLPSTEAKT